MKMLGKAIPENMTNVIPPSNPNLGGPEGALDMNVVDNGEEVTITLLIQL